MKLELTNTHLERLQVQDLRNEIVQKLNKTHRKFVEQQSKLGELRRAKVRGEHSIKTKIFKVLKNIGIELSSYHGGSLTRKDIKKVMNNATHIFDEFAAVFRNGARVGCVLSNDGRFHVPAFLGGIFFVGWRILVSKNNASNTGECTNLPKVCRRGIA
jgi:hypothetical protein